MSVLAQLVSTAFIGGEPTAALQDPEPRSPNSYVFHIGARVLDDVDFYEPVEDDGVLGFEYVRDFSGGSSAAGLGLEFGAFLAGDSDEILGSDIVAAFLEGSVGLRAHLDAGRFQFFAGAGPTFILAAFDIENGPDDSDTSAGFYVHGGSTFRLDDDIALGLDLRAVAGTDISFSGFVGTDADYGQVSLILEINP